MAITWGVKITILNIERREVSVKATRTDDTNPQNIDVKTYMIPGALIATVAQKTAVIDEIWAYHQAALSKETQAAAIISNLENQTASALMAKE